MATIGAAVLDLPNIFSKRSFCRILVDNAQAICALGITVLGLYQVAKGPKLINERNAHVHRFLESSYKKLFTDHIGEQSDGDEKKTVS